MNFDPFRKKLETQKEGMSDKSKQILDRLDPKDAKGNQIRAQPFMVNAEDYGHAIAEDIMNKLKCKDGSNVLDRAKGYDASKIDFDIAVKKRIQFNSGSYGLIYTGNNVPIGISPFVWQLDQETRRQWAVFNFEDFYFKNKPPLYKISGIKSRFYQTLVLTPFDKSTAMTDPYPKGYLAKFDSDTQFQMGIHIPDTKEQALQRTDSKNFISAALLLFMDLSQYTKPKFNLRLVIVILIIAVLVCLAYYYLHTHPQILGQMIGFSV